MGFHKRGLEMYIGNDVGGKKKKSRDKDVRSKQGHISAPNQRIRDFGVECRYRHEHDRVGEG